MTGFFWKAFEFLELCSRNRITFNHEKLMVARDTVEYMGFEITANSMRPSPKNITAIRAFFWLVNQVSYTFSMKDIRELLRPSARFYWDENLQKRFEEAKWEVVKKVEQGVKMFEMNRTTCVATDWSQEGVGLFLFPKHCDCSEVKIGCCNDGWQLILAGSRFLKTNEQNWSKNKIKHLC